MGSYSKQENRRACKDFANVLPKLITLHKQEYSNYIKESFKIWIMGSASKFDY